MKYKIRHSTIYDYTQAVSHCYNLGYVLPRNTLSQKLLSQDIDVLPKAASINTYVDYFGNSVFSFNVPDSHKHLEITAHSVLDVNHPHYNDKNLSNSLSCVDSQLQLRQQINEASLKAREFTLPSPMIKHHDNLAIYARSSFDSNRPLLVAVMELTQRIFQDFTYDPGFSTVATPLQDVFKHKRGVCQDFAHLAIGCLRSLGFSARYVSGYLETLPPPGQKKLVGSDASHAWFAVYCPNEGWYDFDPTNNKMTTDQYITTAWGRDYSDVPPVKGVIFGGGKSHNLSVAVDVERLT